MGIKIRGQVVARNNNALVAGCSPGLYKSKKGSFAIVPDSNCKGNGKLNGISQALITDVDTGKTFFKDIAKIKGEYTKVADLANVNLEYEGCAAGNCRDF